FSMALLIPLWLQNNLSYTAIWSGLATAPVGIIPIMLVYFIGKYAAHYDLRWMASISFTAMALVCYLFSQMTLYASFWDVAFIELLLGVGVAFFFMPVLTILLSDLKT